MRNKKQKRLKIDAIIDDIIKRFAAFCLWKKAKKMHFDSKMA